MKKKKRKWNLRKREPAGAPQPGQSVTIHQEIRGSHCGPEHEQDRCSEELKTNQDKFRDFMARYNANSRNVYPDLNETELRSLAHVNPDANFDEEEFYFRHQHGFSTREEYKAAQEKSRYPIRLLIGLKKLRRDDDTDLIKSFTDILGSLTQPTDRPSVDHLASHEFTSYLTLNTLTLNNGNLARNPKLGSREVKYMSMKERPLIMMMLQNSDHIICLNKADACLYPEDEKSKDLIKLFIKFGYKGIALKSVLVSKTNRMLCPRRKASQSRANTGGTTFGMFRCYFVVLGEVIADWKSSRAAPWAMANGRSALVTCRLSKAVDGVSLLFLPCPWTLVRGGNLLPMCFC